MKWRQDRQYGQSPNEKVIEFTYRPAYEATWDSACTALGIERCSGAAIVAATDECGVNVVKNRTGPIGFYEWDKNGCVII